MIVLALPQGYLEVGLASDLALDLVALQQGADLLLDPFGQLDFADQLPWEEDQVTLMDEKGILLLLSCLNLFLLLFFQ